MITNTLLFFKCQVTFNDCLTPPHPPIFTAVLIPVVPQKLTIESFLLEKHMFYSEWIFFSFCKPPSSISLSTLVLSLTPPPQIACFFSLTTIKDSWCLWVLNVSVLQTYLIISTREGKELWCWIIGCDLYIAEKYPASSDLGNWVCKVSATGMTSSKELPVNQSEGSAWTPLTQLFTLPVLESDSSHCS